MIYFILPTIILILSVFFFVQMKQDYYDTSWKILFFISLVGFIVFTFTSVMIYSEEAKEQKCYNGELVYCENFQLEKLKLIKELENK